MTGLPDSLNNHVGLFFVVRSDLLLHSCTLNEAEPYGDFLNYALSHDKVWREHYQIKYCVDFDYFPRGRIIYNKEKQLYLLYYDGCIEKEAKKYKVGSWIVPAEYRAMSIINAISAVPDM